MDSGISFGEELISDAHQTQRPLAAPKEHASVVVALGEGRVVRHDKLLRISKTGLPGVRAFPFRIEIHSAGGCALVGSLSSMIH